MKSYLRLCAPVLMALLIAIALVGNAFFSSKEQPTTKIQSQAPTEPNSRATGIAASPVQKSLSLPVRRDTEKRSLFSPITPAPQRIESNVLTASSDAEVAEAKLELSRESGPLLSSNANDLRTRAQKGLVSQGPTQQSSGTVDFAKVTNRKPVESRLQKAPRSFDGDVRDLPYRRPVEREMPEHEDPLIIPRLIGKPAEDSNQINNPPSLQLPAAPAPTPLNVFEGLDRFNFGAGSPPDTNGDVGPQHYVQTVNTSIGIYNKVTGTRTAGFTFDALMSQANFGNLCDTDNFGDPVVVYDTFEDRWIITDFAFLVDGGGNPISPAFQCFAASKSGDPVAGGWNFYSIQINDNINDYPKFGIWPDGLYMTANMYGFGAGGTFQHVRVWAFNKAQMYAGAPTVQNVSFNVGGGDFTILPSNARLQTGTPPAGSPNYFLSSSLFFNALSIYKFHVDWDRISLSTFTGPDIPISATSWPSVAANAAQPGTATLLDTLTPRAMMQNQYTNLGGVESLWVSHTVRRAAAGLAAPRWYQVNVTGGTVNLTIPQASTWDPDAANVVNRFMPSLAVDRAGNMALGYSTSNSTTEFPSIKYAGRLSTDPVNTLSLTEQTFFTGTASQTGTTRWGDYSAMTLDPNGCTFWYTTEYANPADQTFDHRWLTKFGSFQFSPCTTIGNGTLQGTVTTSPGGSPISGATVAFGARTTTTDGSGFYSFAAIPAGTYPTETASKPGLNSSTTTNIVIAEGGTTVKNFALTTAPTNACLVDTTQPDFQLGVPANTDLSVSPGDVKLATPSFIDQQNTTLTTSGAAFSNTAWFGETFTPAVTGQATRVDVDLFCFSCTGTPPNLVISIRNASANLPTGADLASVSVPFSNSGAGGFFGGTFSTPPTLTAGTQYAIVVRMSAAFATGTPAFIVSSVTNPYAGGRAVNSTDSGGTWGTGVVSGLNLTNRDIGFKVFMNNGFAASGNLVSGAKDSNPPPGLFARWTSLSWNATVPANTTLRFQIAGSNDPAGVFNFIGPDGTAATFFTTSPATINNLVNGNRYLKYKAFFTTADGTVTPTVSDVTTCFNQGPTAANGFVSGRITDSNGAAISGAVVNLAGTQSRKTITDAGGNYRFDSVETDGFYTVTPTLVNYHFAPESRSFSLLGNNTDAVFTAMRDAVVTGNAIDTPEYFVRQHYLDFLGREPDESGFNFWSDQITSCGSDAACVERRKINVSAAYFLSIEFQQTGGLVDSLYRASFGRRPMYTEFMPDTAVVARNVVVGQSDWAQILEENKRAFVDAWVQRAAFQSTYGGLTDAGYVDALISNTGVSFSQSEREALVNGLSSGASTRAEVLRQIAENERFVAAKRNESFVMMQYFGYLRREPDADGYAFWLNKLNQFNGNFEQAEMVKAFLVSGEYRNRFLLR
jgi:hypothetical protein